MPKMPSGIAGRSVISALQRLGFIFVRQKGSHVFMRRPGPVKDDTTVVPDHTDLAKGTLKGILRQADVDLEEFMQVL